MVQIKQISRRPENKADPVKAKELMDKLRKEHSKMVKGQFEFIDAQGGWLEFNYRFFPEDMLVTYKFIHGEICEIPMGLVKHLNNTKKKIRSFGMNQDGINGMLPERGVPSSYETVSRVRFTPVDVL